MDKNNIVNYCKAELENIEKVILEMESLLSKKQTGFTVIELSAIATFLHNFYNGVENIFKRIFKYKKFQLSQGDTWHKDMLNIGRDNQLVDEKLYDRLYDYLMFRHMFIHSYSFQLEWDKLKPLAIDLKDTYNTFKKSIMQYIAE